MIEHLTIRLLERVHSNHQILRYKLSRKKHGIYQSTQYFNILSVAVLGLLTLGYVYVMSWLHPPASTNLTDIILHIIYFPMFFLQFGLQIYMFSSTIYSVGSERRRLRWDIVSITEIGEELSIRTWWIAVFYRMRRWLGIVFVVRCILILGMLYDLTAFRGHYLEILTVNVTPEISLLSSIFLFGLLITAGIFLPFTASGLDAAFGLLISTKVRQRIFIALIHGVIVAIRITVIVGLLVVTTQILQGKLELIDPVAWVILFIFAAFADCGLLFLHLGALGVVWASVPYAMFLGLALVIFILIQTFIIDRLLGHASR